MFLCPATISHVGTCNCLQALLCITWCSSHCIFEFLVWLSFLRFFLFSHHFIIYWNYKYFNLLHFHFPVLCSPPSPPLITASFNLTSYLLHVWFREISVTSLYYFDNIIQLHVMIWLACVISTQRMVLTSTPSILSSFSMR